MANSEGRVFDRKVSQSPQREQFVPSSGWTEDLSGRYLLVDLPGFKKEEVKLQVYNSGKVVISGERKVDNTKHLYFERTFKVPDNTDADRITGKFDGEILYVTMPKLIKEEKKEPETENEDVKPVATDEKSPKEVHKDDTEASNKEEEDVKKQSKTPVTSFSEETVKKWEEDRGILKGAMEVLRKNGGIVITAVLAFSLGVLVSHKLESTRLRTL